MQTYEQYRAMLKVSKHHLDDELEIHAEVMEQLTTEVALRNTLMIRAKDDLAREEGKLAEDIKEDEPKLSIGAIDAKVKRDPYRVKSWTHYQNAREGHEKWVGLLEAWRQKGFTMKNLSDLYSAQYFALNSTSARPERDQAHQDQLRERMRGAGRAEAQEAPKTRRRVVI